MLQKYGHRAILGATARQLAELDQLFPHRGQPQPSLAEQRRAATPIDNRQIYVQRPPPDPSLLRGVPIERTQIVGAYAEQADTSGGDWKSLGLPLTPIAGVAIAAGATYDFELKPNRLFLPGILSMESTLAVNLIMYNLTIGGHNCMLSSGAWQMSAFSNLTIHKPFEGWAASNAQPITFTLKNIHASASQVVYGVWWGLAQDA